MLDSIAIDIFPCFAVDSFNRLYFIIYYTVEDRILVFNFSEGCTCLRLPWSDYPHYISSHCRSQDQSEET